MTHKQAMPEETQNMMILLHLQSGQSLTPLEALHLCGALRLGARIHELKAKGHVIVTTMLKDSMNPRKRFASYSMGVQKRRKRACKRYVSTLASANVELSDG